MENINELPPSVEKLLFAVDVVSYFFDSRCPHMPLEFKDSKIVEVLESNRQVENRRFTEDIKKMIAVIDDTQSVLVRRDFLEYQNMNEVNRESLMEYSKAYKDCYLSQGFYGRSFLMYCTRMSVMGCYFFKDNMVNALDIVVDLIVSAFPEDQNMSNAVWDSLNDVAKKYLSTEGQSPVAIPPQYLRREPIDPISSDTEESSSSSVMNSESDNAADILKVPSTSDATSSESLAVEMTNLHVCSTENTDVSSLEGKSSIDAKSDEGTSVCDKTSPTTGLKQDIPEKKSSCGLILTLSTDETVPDSTSDDITGESPNRMTTLGKRASPREEYPDLPAKESRSSLNLNLLTAENVSDSTSENIVEVSQTHKSALGKRVSPRKEHSDSADTDAERSAEEIASPIDSKKLKLRETEKND